MSEQAEAQRKAIEQQRRLEVAFVTVFGESDATRSDHQRLVWDWLEHVCFRRRPMIYPSPAGTIDPTQLASNAANHALFTRLESLVNAGGLPLNPLTHPKPETIRQ